MKFEPVFTVTDFYDGPRRGVASFEGAPHFYDSEWDDDGDNTFLVSPISDDDLRLALEDWAIWLRWREAWEVGLTTLESHPALPADRERHLQLKALLSERLATGPHFVRVCGTFRSDPHLEVRWERR